MTFVFRDDNLSILRGVAWMGDVNRILTRTLRGALSSTLQHRQDIDEITVAAETAASQIGSPPTALTSTVKDTRASAVQLVPHEIAAGSVDSKIQTSHAPMSFGTIRVIDLAAPSLIADWSK